MTLDRNASPPSYPTETALDELRYWHPIFAAWRETRNKVSVRYHPEDLSRLFVSANGKSYVEARFADLGRPHISLWEQRVARKALRASGSADISEALIFKTIERQRRIVASASSQTRRMSAAATSSRRSQSRHTLARNCSSCSGAHQARGRLQSDAAGVAC